MRQQELPLLLVLTKAGDAILWIAVLSLLGRLCILLLFVAVFNLK